MRDPFGARRRRHPERKVENVTDTPYVNHCNRISPCGRGRKLPTIQPGDELSVVCAHESFSGPKGAFRFARERRCAHRHLSIDGQGHRL
jgi:hypothetical protein